jgi:2-polyprenyl-3-methyl-5-hydroxy-6-metoxy-1,4-benzoquinol methylase
MVYLDPLPPEQGDAYYDQLGQPYYLSADKLAGDYAASRFDRECRVLRRHCPRGEVLDVGCGTGAFLWQLRQRFGGDYRGVGIEISRAALGYARSRGMEVYADSVLTHDFGDRHFAAVTFWAVLEHLEDPAAFVRRACALLSPGGVCIALVPNSLSLSMRLLGARYRYVLPQHLNYFALPDLRRLFSDAGLEIVATGASHFNPMVLWQDAWRHGSDFVPDVERAALLRRTTGWKQTPWLRPAKLLHGIIERALALADLADNLWIVGRRR